MPLTLKRANDVVAGHHRHARRTSRDGGLFAVGVAVRGQLVGVAIVGRPIARLLDDGESCEVTRLCVVPGVSELHVCSSLYGRCVRVARELGYRRVLTYTLASESGTSLRAAGFARVAEVPAAKTWGRAGRSRRQTEMTLFGPVEKRDAGPKVRWERTLGKRSGRAGGPQDREGSR